MPKTVPLDRSVHDRKGFTCGKESLDRYFREQAGKEGKRKTSVCWVFPDDNDPSVVCGFYTLSSFSVALVDLPENTQKRLPKYPQVPATMLGRLAISKDYAGQGLGEFLLLDALKRSLITSDVIGSAMVIVDPKDEDSTNFYRKYDFRPIEEEGTRLFLPMRTIAQLFA